MALQRLADILAVAALGVVNASPCKPHSSVALSSTISLGSSTALQETASSTITADVTDTTNVLDTTITESAVSTGTTDVFESTMTETATDTATTDAAATVEPTTIANDVTTFLTSAVATEESTSAEPTTTTAAAQPPVCVETQVLANPSFDDNSNAWPWMLGEGVTVSQINPRSEPYFIYNTVIQARKTTIISQTFNGVTGFTFRLEYFFNMQTAINGRGFSCSTTPSINGRQLPSSAVLTDQGPYGFRHYQTYFDLENDGPKTLAITVECSGSFNTIIIGLDDVALTKVCFRAE